MPPAKKNQPAAEPAAEIIEGPLYPQIEAFIERATGDDVAGLFDPLKDDLSALKGPRADQAKRVNKAIARTEELLAHLLQVREKLEAERKGSR